MEQGYSHVSTLLVAPGHCTGEVGFSVLSRVFGSRYLYAGLGSVIERVRADLPGRYNGRVSHPFTCGNKYVIFRV